MLLYIFGVPPSNPLTLSPGLTFNKEDRDRLPLPIFPETRVLFPNFCQLSTPSHPIKTFELINVICIYLCYIHSYEQSLFPLNSVNHHLLVFSIQSSLQIFYECFFWYFYLCCNVFCQHLISSSNHDFIQTFQVNF